MLGFHCGAKGMRRAAKIDGNQTEIVKRLREVGVQVEVLEKPLDLLLAIRHKDGSWETALMECKTEDGRFTGAQVRFMERWPGRIEVVRSPEEAVRAVLGEEVMR